MPLGKMIRLEYGKPLPPVSRDPGGRFAVYGANGIKDRANICYRSEPSIIVGRKGSAGEVTLTEEAFWPLDVTYFVEFDRRRHDLKFLYYLLVSLDLPRLAKGVKPGINREEVYAEVVPAPPFAEQQRIVTILDEAFEEIATATANAEKKLANTRELFDGYVDRVFETLSPKITQVRLQEACMDITVGHVGPMASFYQRTGVPFLRSQNIKPLELDLSNVAFIDEEFDAKLAKSRLAPGDVAIVRTGYPGTAAVIPLSLQAANCANLVIARPGPRLSPDFLAFFLNSRFGRSAVSGNLTGAAQKHFNVTAAKQVFMPLPELPLQETIIKRAVEVREQTKSLESIYNREIGFLTKLRKSILARAFSGELTSSDVLGA